MLDASESGTLAPELAQAAAHPRVLAVLKPAVLADAGAQNGPLLRGVSHLAHLPGACLPIRVFRADKSLWQFVFVGAAPAPAAGGGDGQSTESYGEIVDECCVDLPITACFMAALPCVHHLCLVWSLCLVKTCCVLIM